MTEKQLKILFVSRDNFPPFRVDVAILFGKEMIRRGHRIDWVLQSEAELNKAYITQWTGGRVWVGPTNTGESIAARLHKHLLGFTHNMRFARLVNVERYDCVQLKDRFFSSLIYLALARLRGVKFCFWLSYPFPEASLYESKSGSARYPLVYLLRGILYKLLLYKIIARFADHVFVQSEQMKKDMQGQGVDANKMTPIPMGFDFDGLSIGPAKSNVQHAPGGQTVVYMGTLIRVRRIDFLIRMFVEVVAKFPMARLFLIGKGDSQDDIEFLKSTACEMGIPDSVILTGFMQREQALDHVKAADVCLSPFFPTPILNSTSPTKIIEYMAMGKPVVANDHPEQKLILEQSGGGICVPYREASFSEAVTYLLGHPEERARMGKSGSDWAVKNRSYAKLAALVEATYLRQVLSNPREDAPF